MKAFVAKQGITVEYDAKIAPALGMSSGGHIWLMPGMPKGEEFSVLVHELAHEMMHHAKDTQPLPKIVRETQAEAVAFVVCRSVGLETNNAAADYVALYHEDKKTLAESLSVIQETSAKILNDLLPERFATAHERTAELIAPGLKSADIQTGHEVRESKGPVAAPDKQDSLVLER